MIYCPPLPRFFFFSVNVSTTFALGTLILVMGRFDRVSPSAMNFTFTLIAGSVEAELLDVALGM